MSKNKSTQVSRIHREFLWLVICEIPFNDVFSENVNNTFFI